MSCIHWRHFKIHERAQEAERELREVRRPVRSCGPGCLVEIRAIELMETKHEATDAASSHCGSHVRCAVNRSSRRGGRTPPKAKNVANFLLLKPDWTHLRFSTKSRLTCTCSICMFPVSVRQHLIGHSPSWSPGGRRIASSKGPAINRPYENLSSQNL